jgi:hypothetical protein
MLSILFTFILTSSNSYAVDKVCKNWFNKLVIKNDCLSECTIAPVNMSNFLCHNSCEILCSDSSTATYSLLKKYGLTEDEIALCEKNKISCIKAYKLSWDSEKICLKQFTSSRTNDESDACRHFVWSILLAKDLGFNFAEKILNAHENNPKGPEDERAMDLSNNRYGLITFEKNKDIIWTDDKILTFFNVSLKENKLIVLKSSKKNKGNPP